MKICTKCGVEKDESDFGSNGAGRKRPDCLVCNAATRRQYYRKNKPACLRATNKWRRDNRARNAHHLRKQKYGITSEQYEQRLKDQNNCCASCGDTFENLKDTHVDHDHVTKEIRGLLCYHCNVGIGLFKDSSMRLLLAIRYLQKFST